jgi:hypothetical protein
MLAFIKCLNTFTYIGLLSSSLPVFFFLEILCYNQSGDGPQEDLAKFGYKLNMKKKTSFYIFGYLLELCIEIWITLFEKL